jgi:hypothetical protein
MKQMLMQELEMDKGIDLVLKAGKKGELNTLAKLKQACQIGQITVEFIEVGTSGQS